MGRKDESGESCKTIQIFVKMDGSRTIAMDVAPNDRVSDMMKRIPSGVGKCSEEAESCAIAESVVDARLKS